MISLTTNLRRILIALKAWLIILIICYKFCSFLMYVLFVLKAGIIKWQYAILLNVGLGTQ